MLVKLKKFKAKTMIRKTSALYAGALALLLSYNVQALPISLATGESALFNFDLTSEGPALFTDIVVSFNVTGPGAGELFGFHGYNELFGDDFAFGFDNLAIGLFVANVPDGGGFADGLFSLRFISTVGPIELTALDVTGVDASGLPVAVDAVPIPEPSALFLLSLGLAGMCYSRRKQVVAA